MKSEEFEMKQESSSMNQVMPEPRLEVGVFETATCLKDDGSVPLTNNWNAGEYEIKAKKFRSTTTIEPPFVISSNAKVMSLNADMLDGYHAKIGVEAGAIPLRDSNGALDGDIKGNAATATTGPSYSSGFLYILSGEDEIDLAKKISKNELSTDSGSWLTMDFMTIWKEFEFIGYDIRAVRFLVELSTSSGSANGDNRLEVRFRKNITNSKEEPRPLVVQTFLANDKRETSLFCDVPVDESLKFQMKWDKTLTSGAKCGFNIYLVGFYK